MSFDDLPLFAVPPARVVAESQRSLAEGYVAEVRPARQEAELARVSERISAAIVAFVRALPPPREFHADQLRAAVTRACGAVAPGSADRVLRDLRQRGVVVYRVINRSQSLYKVEEG